MTFFGLLASVLVPTLLGMALVRLQLRQRPLDEAPAVPPNWPLVIGYGGVIGAVVATLLMRLSSLAGIAWNFWVLSGVILGLAILLHLITQNNQRGDLAALEVAPLPERTTKSAEPWLQWLFYGLLALLVLRFINLGFEVTQRPLYPWDAWTQWATKAKVFFDAKAMVSFATLDTYLTANAAAVFTDAAPTYPPTVSLLQAFSALSIGRFDDALVNVPWLSCWVFLCAAFYGQARQWGMSAIAALLATYVLGSLPFVNTHVALAGYAELHMATVFGLGAIAFFSWASGSGDKRQLFIAIFLLLACVEIKRPGIFWLLSVVPGVFVWWRPKVGLILLAIGTAILIAAGFAFAKSGMTLAGFRVGQDLSEVSIPIVQNVFLMGNWNLLFFFGIAIVVFSWRSLFAGVHAVLTSVVFAGCVFLFIVFYFRISAYVSDFTTINRAMVHFVPVLVFYFATLAWARVQQLGSAAADNEEFYRGRMQEPRSSPKRQNAQQRLPALADAKSTSS